MGQYPAMSTAFESRFAGTRVIVTGAASGIGRVTAARFAAEGASVAVADRDAEGVARVVSEIEAAGGRALGCLADVAVTEQVNAMAARAAEALGGVDVLVNNAAVCSADGVLETDDEAWDRELSVDLRGVFACTRAVLPGMIERGSGAIVNMTSVNGLAFFGNEAYSAAKAGVVSFTRSVAVRYGRHGVRCNAVAPGTIRTPAWDDRARRDPTVFDRLARVYPLGRVGEPEDVAAAVLFLASADASWITGTVLRVDGGILAGAPAFVETVRDL